MTIAVNRNLSKIARKKVFRGFNGIRTRGLCVRSAVLYQLSYEDPYTRGRPIYYVSVAYDMTGIPFPGSVHVRIA